MSKNAPKTAAAPEAAPAAPARRRRCKRFTLPAGCDITTVVVAELRGRDEIQAALHADALATEAERKSGIAAITLEKREAIKLSLVRVDDQPVDELVLMGAAEDWTVKTWTALAVYFNDLNGIPGDELGKSLAAATECDEYGNPLLPVKEAATGQ